MIILPRIIAVLIWELSMVRIGLLIVTAVLTTAIAGCSNENDQSSGKGPDWQRGRAVFLANCVACHNNDPSKDGSIGPAIAGSSKELLEARVLSTSYPANYKPKRPTKIMPQFPFLKEDVPYLAAYLAK
jgi:mono/diheme cytochrome c family protein